MHFTERTLRYLKQNCPTYKLSTQKAFLMRSKTDVFLNLTSQSDVRTRRGYDTNHPSPPYPPKHLKALTPKDTQSLIKPTILTLRSSTKTLMGSLFWNDKYD